MTSREATPLLTRDAEIEIERGLGDWARLLAFGAVQWPWLLRSLYGGRKRDKAALLDRLGLPRDALPNLGSWKADTSLLDRVVEVILADRPRIVVELGAGATTLVAARALSLAGGGGRLVSVDQHQDFVEATREWLAAHGERVELHHAPITSPSGKWRDLWYDLPALPSSIDLLLIDGPPWTIDPETRGKAASLFAQIALGGRVILDDAARPGERLVAREWARDWPDFEWTYTASIKGRLEGVKRA